MVYEKKQNNFGHPVDVWMTVRLKACSQDVIMDVIFIQQSSPRKNSKNGSSQGNSLPSNSPPRTPTFKTNSFSQPSVTQTSPASTSSPIIIKASKHKFTKLFNHSYA